MPLLQLSDEHRSRLREELAGDSTWSSERARRFVDLGALVAMAAAVLDATETYVVLAHSSHGERNPLVDAVMHSIGIAPTLAADAFVRLGIVVVLAYIATRAVRPVVRFLAAATIGAAAVWWSVVVFANAVVLARP
jgi:hypothetical protein